MDRKALEADCEALMKAMKGWGTDDAALIKIIANRTNAYRQQLKVTYKSMYGRDLVDELKSETSGNFEDAIVALFYTPVDYDCYSLMKAMKGAGTNEDTLTEIIASRSNSQLKTIIARYKEIYGKDLEKQVASEVSGDYKKILISLLQCNRSENKNPDPAVCEQKAKDLYAAGEGKWGTDESVFNKIFATASPAELLQIAKYYHAQTKRTILQAIDAEFSGKMKQIYRAVVYALISPSEYFATRVDDACRGLGTRDAALIRVVVTRDEIDMPQIKAIYKKLYNKDMIDTIKSECSGSYKKLLVELADH